MGRQGAMMSGLDKWRGKDALSAERRLMNEALAKLGEMPIRPKARGHGRLLFVLDLTGSREPSLRNARIATAAMFDALRTIGAIAVKLIYYRGNNECRASAWHDDPRALSQTMQKLGCESGETQIARVLNLALDEKELIDGVVFVGDHNEDNADKLLDLATKLGKRSIPLFVFHECADNDKRSLKAKPVFKRMAETSGGVYVEFKPDSGAVLREMLSSVAAFSAAGSQGVKQVAAARTPEARQLQARLLIGPGSGV
jgi:hypothetical protein